MRTIAITGASGFVGRALIEAALARGVRVIALTRALDRPKFPAQVDVRRFDPSGPADPTAFEGADAVVHLAGESVAGRWTAEKKDAIRRSRITGTRRVVESIAACKTRPRVFVCASASGYYGARGDEPLVESSLRGNDFLAQVCTGWEREAMRACELGIRTVTLRTGIVLGDGGALAQLRVPYGAGVGGPLGTGRQFVPWIHLDDLARLYLWTIERDDVRGAVNAVAPDYATNARFSQAIGAAMSRPALLPAPAPALRLLLGEFAETLLNGQIILPAIAEDRGFTWSHPNLERALHQILSPQRELNLPLRFHFEQRVPADIVNVFAFFAGAQNLEAITPPFLRFGLERIPATMERGTIIDYRMRLRGIPMRWKTLIAAWDPPYRFVDVQLHGPYASWRHEHTLREAGGGVEIVDDIEYVMPLLPFGSLAQPLVRRDVEQIFAYRETAIAHHFGETTRHRCAAREALMIK